MSPLRRLFRSNEQDVFAELIADTLGKFSNTPKGSIRAEIAGSLRRIGDLCDCDPVCLFRYEANEREFALWHTSRVTVAPELPGWSEDEFPHSLAELTAGRAVMYTSLEEIPSEAVQDRSSFLRLGGRPLLAIPLHNLGNLVGLLSVRGSRNRRKWPDAVVTPFTRLGELLSLIAGSADLSEMSEPRVDASEITNPLVLDPTGSYAVVLDENGYVVSTNWNPSSPMRLPFPPAEAKENYLDCWKALAQKDEVADEFCNSLLAVITGRKESATLEFCYLGSDGERVLAIQARRPQGLGPLTFVTHVDLTRSSQFGEAGPGSELELGAALAHEIAQPLSAIQYQAAAALTMLGRPALDARLLAEMIESIFESNQRAQAIATSVRRLARSEPDVMGLVDLNGVVKNVVRALEREVQFRGVRLKCDLSRALPAVVGDEAQLHQVVVNLVMNALEAVEKNSPETRDVGLWSFYGGSPARVVVEVADRGPGVPLMWRERIFQPFFSTKQQGLGVGLSISRSIAEAHGGTVRLTGGEDGARFQLTVPAASRIPEPKAPAQHTSRRIG